MWPRSTRIRSQPGWVLTRNTVHSWADAALCAVAVAASLHGRINPVWLIGLGAVAGVVWGG